MGRTRSSADVRSLAASYGRKMAGLGVDVDLAPVTSRPTRPRWGRTPVLGRRACAARASPRWSSTGPGDGQASNTHDRPATAPPLSTLEKRDLLPFADLLRTGVPAVMVGHLNVPGLTEQGVPATLSRTRTATCASGPALTGCS
jgi:beta-N-acetylhexosaminidase